jgi:hypothetical protein
MSLLGWGMLMFGIWVALNIVVYEVLDHNARNSHDSTRKWGSVLMINEGTPFYVAIIAIVLTMLFLAVVPAFPIAEWVNLRRNQAQRH